MEQADASQREEHRVHLINYHLIWCPPRRTPVLVGSVAARCRAVLAGKRAEQGWHLLALAGPPDHLHLFVRGWPSDRAAAVVKACQGSTACTLRQAFPPLLTLPSLWTRASCASMAGTVRQATLQRSIAAQTRRSR